MKAIIVTPYYAPKVGGLEIYAQQLNIALKKRQNWDIVVVTSNHNGPRTVVETIDGMKVYRLGRLLKFSNTPLNPLWPLMMKRLFAREKPDVILTHTPVPSMADAARLAAGSTPLFVFYHAATLLKGDSKIFDTIAKTYQAYEHFLLVQARRIFPVSDFVREQFSYRFWEKSQVVPNAVWEKHITTRRQPTKQNFLFVGSLEKTHAWKGLELIIRALARARAKRGADYTLTIMGNGNDRARYEALVVELGLQNAVTFTGNLSGAKKDAAFKDAYALLMYPTSANDAFPTVMLEAWARAVPVISAAIGPMPTLIRDKKDGLLVRPHDIDALAKTMHHIAGMDSASRRSLTLEAQKRVRQHYTWEKQAERVDALVREAIK